MTDRSDSWPTGAGGMARRIRKHDWSATTLGPIEAWPDRLRGVVDLMLATPAAVSLLLGPDALHLYNDSVATGFDQRFPEALGQPVDLLGVDVQQTLIPVYRRAMAGESVVVPDLPLDSPIRTESVDLFVVPLLDDDGNAYGAWLSYRESRSQVQDLEQRRMSREAQIRLLAEVSRELVDLTSIPETMNRIVAAVGAFFGVTRVLFAERIDEFRFEILFGWHAPGTSKMSGSRDIRDFLDSEQLDRHAAGEVSIVSDFLAKEQFQVASSLERDIRSIVIFPLAREGGTAWRFLLVVPHSQPREWSHDELALIAEIATRIWMRLERARVEEALRRSEARFRAVANVVPDLLWESDSKGRSLWQNDRWHGYTGQSVTDSPQLGWLDVIHPDDRPELLRDFKRANSHGELFQHEARFRGADGTYRWFISRGVPVRDEHGTIIRWIGSNTDIHEERIARDELERRVESATATLRQLSRRLILVQEEERRFLAQELHDEIGQMLTGLSLTLSNPPKTANELDEARAIVSELTEQVRQLSMDLRPAALDAYGVVASIRGYLHRYESRTGIMVDLRVEGVDRRFPAPVEIAAYRVVQEALTNLARHADATSGTVQLVADDATLFISIRDAGRGFNLADVREGSGIGGMRERVELLGGHFDIDSSPGSGVVIAVELPIDGQPDRMASENTESGQLR